MGDAWRERQGGPELGVRLMIDWPILELRVVTLNGDKRKKVDPNIVLREFAQQVMKVSTKIVSIRFFNFQLFEKS